MRRLAKTILYRLGLGRVAERLYFNLKTATPRVILTEIGIRLFKTERQPVPPGRLIYDVIACRWADVYLRSGRKLADSLNETARAVGFEFRGDTNVLDFGCGCGRLTRYLIEDTDSRIFGTDYNPQLIAWCRAHLPRATFSTNHLAPPLGCRDAMFDLVIARSVFTHLTEEMQMRWLDEMQRILRTDGFLYLSLHGPLLASGLSAEQRARFDAGEIVVIHEDAEGANLCSSFAGPEFVRSRFTRDFELVRYEPGRPVTHLRQDVYVLRRK
ncbi:MAG: class I SAM-dependent methyltransferase [Rhodothermales bacterium]